MTPKTIDDLKPKLALKNPDELKAALEHSTNGFLTVLFGEKAFRTELVVFAVCALAAALIPNLSWCERSLLVFSAFQPLLAELTNTAIEKTIDRISLDYHELSKLAKDIGSTLVLASFVGAGICWGMILFGWCMRYFH